MTPDHFLESTLHLRYDVGCRATHLCGLCSEDCVHDAPSVTASNGGAFYFSLGLSFQLRSVELSLRVLSGPLRI